MSSAITRILLEHFLRKKRPSGHSGQYIRAIIVRILVTSCLTKHENFAYSLSKIRTRIDGILDSVRRFSHELRPGDLDAVRLIPTLERLTEESKREGKTVATLEVIGTDQRLPAEVELTLFRIAQEALRNVRNHSGATEVKVKIEFTHNKVKLDVIDNGIGFDFPKALGDFAPKGKLGLVGMNERARLLNGSLSVKSQHGKGTTITVELPL